MKAPGLMIVPVVVFLVLLAMAAVPLLRGDDPAKLQSVLIDQPVPAFKRAEFGSGDFKGRVTLINFFASWCPPCEAENDQLMRLKNDEGVAIYGIDYKDSDSGRQDFLARLGNPYAAVTADKDGQLAILFGTYGVPETFIIDPQGRVRYRHAAPLTPDDIDGTILPLIRSLRQ